MEEFLNDIPEDNEITEPSIKILEKWMQTHLITNLTEFGVWDDNYDKFFRERAKIISDQLQKKNNKAGN